MLTRKSFISQGALLAGGHFLLPAWVQATGRRVKNTGVQLYTFRKEMEADAPGTLEKIAALGIRQIESAKSAKGHFYGLSAAEMKRACDNLGMTLRSSHVHIDGQWQQTMAEAAASGQEYLICSTLPTEGQTVDNYKKVAEVFNKAGEACKNMGLRFGYHNHEYEFETAGGQVLYDVLLDNTAADLVHMELDLGWVLVGGKDPLDYFARYPGRFPLWHLKDMDVAHKHSVEFGKGGLDIKRMLRQARQAGMQYFFVEQEEYASTPFDSMRHNMDYLKKLRY